MNDNSKQPLTEEEPILSEEETFTPQEELFCQLVARGESYKSAMRNSFPHRSKWKDISLYKVSSLLANEPRMAKKILEEKQEVAANYFLSYEAKRAIIKAKIEDPNISERERSKYMEIDNKMAGHDSATKIEQNGNLSLTHSVAPEISEALENMFSK